MKSSKLTKGMGHRTFDESELCSVKMSFVLIFALYVTHRRVYVLSYLSVSYSGTSLPAI